MCRLSKIDVSPFEDRCHDVSTFGDGCVDFRRTMCRPSEMDVLTCHGNFCPIPKLSLDKNFLLKINLGLKFAAEFYSIGQNFAAIIYPTWPKIVLGGQKFAAEFYPRTNMRWGTNIFVTDLRRPMIDVSTFEDR